MGIKELNKVLVCGGRHYKNRDHVFATLDDQERPLMVIQGGCFGGADRWAREWAEEHGVMSVTVHAHWKHYRYAAGPIRNSWMLILKPDKVLAFPGGKGTASMVKLANEVKDLTIVEFCFIGKVPYI